MLKKRYLKVAIHAETCEMQVVLLSLKGNVFKVSNGHFLVRNVCDLALFLYGFAPGKLLLGDCDIGNTRVVGTC